jgi:ADP-ribose pyrophosphatase
MGTLYPNPAIQTNSMYCFLALGAEKIAEQELDDGEDIEVHLVPLDELIEMTKCGEFPHALQVAALFLATNYLNGK